LSLFTLGIEWLHRVVADSIVIVHGSSIKLPACSYGFAALPR
jgi:hypothetical protein